MRIRPRVGEDLKKKKKRQKGMWHTARLLNGRVCLVVVTHSLPAHTPPDSHQRAELSWLYKCECVFIFPVIAAVGQQRVHAAKQSVDV